MSKPKHPGLTRRASGLMALEPRFMFDGAAVDVAHDQLVDATPADSPESASAEIFLLDASASGVASAAQLAQQQVRDYMLRATDEQLFELFNGGKTAADSQWTERLSSLREALANGSFAVNVVTMDRASQFTAMAAFAQEGPNGEPTVFINTFWLDMLGAPDVTRVLVEELGHAVDAYLNPNGDTTGDEGESFADHVLGGGLNSAPSTEVLAQNDHGTVTVDGVSYEVEFASLNFKNAYEMVYDQDNDTASTTVTASAIDVSERWADKEQNSHFFNATVSLGITSMTDGTGNQNFSGNDVSGAVSVTIGSATYYGWISRPIKSNGIVRGFYFWTDNDFNNLSAAQNDGNQDRGVGDPGSVDNRGFLLVVDQDWFNEQITANGVTKTINNNKDGNDGTITVANVGSSSDRVDAALNSVMPPNSAPVAANDTLSVAEDSGTTTVSVANGLLSNDTDVNNDALTITGYTISGVAGTQAVGSTVTIAGKGDIRINADGSYSFTPVANYTGSVPPITYTVSDGNGGTTSAVLSISVTPVNSPPVATTDSANVTEDTPVLGSVLGNDSDPDGDTLTVTAFSISGLTGSFVVGTPYTLSGIGVFTLNANGSYTFLPATNFTGAVPTVSYTISDGRGGTSSSTLVLTMVAVNDAPVANSDNLNGALFATAAGCSNSTAIAATTQTGNVLSNDTDPDVVAVVGGTTHEVTAVSSETGASWTSGTVQGRFGSLAINADGSYTYTIDNNNSQVKVLTSSQSLSEYFTYTMTEKGSGTLLSSTSVLRIVVKGSNDGPTARPDFDTVNELSASSTTNGVTHYGTAIGSTSATGVLGNDSDPDNDTLTVGEISTTGRGTASYSSHSSGGTSLSLAFDGTPASLSTSYYVYWHDNGAELDSTPIILYSNSAATVFLRPSSISGTGANKTVTIDVSGAVYYKDSSNVIQSLTLAQDQWVAFYTGTTPDTGNAKYYEAKISSPPASNSSVTFSSYSLISGTVSVGSSYTATAGATSFSGAVTDITYTAAGAINTFTVSTSISITSGSYTFDFSNSISSGESINGQYGRLDLASNGTYIYYLTSNALATDQVFLEKFSYTATDGSCSSSSELTIRISGNTVQVVDTSATVLEDGVGSGTVGLGGSTVASFTWNGVSYSAGSTSQSISGVGSLVLNTDGSYTFTPALNYNGPVPTVTYILANGSASTLSLAITPVNDEPSGTDKTVGLTDKQTYTFGSFDFGFGDPNDSPANAFSGVKITTLPTSGTLTLNGTSVTLGQTVSIANINSGLLVFTPVANAASNASSSFTFQVQDNGGTANSGVDLDQSANTFTFTVSRVNDAPVNTLPASLTTNSYSAISISGLSTTDPDRLASDHRIASVVLQVSHGTLAVTSGAGITATLSDSGRTLTLVLNSGDEADLNAVLATLSYTPNSLFSGTDQLSMTTTDVAGLKDIDSVPITVNADARTLAVEGTRVNEASPYVLFEVTGAENQWVSLQLASTGSGNTHASLGTDVLSNLQYFDGNTWVNYTSGLIRIPDTLANNGKLLVRAPVLQDMPYEGEETLRLVARNQAGTVANGTSIIVDDGTGHVYTDDNNSFTPSAPGANGYPNRLDDDRPVTVNNIAVNEASPWAMFTITGYANQVLSLALSNGTATVGDGSPADGTEDYSPDLQYWDGSAWTAYNGTSVTMAGTTLLVRTAVHQDALFEGQHVFNLGVNKQSSNTTVYGSASIYDDGTGSIYAFDNDNDGSVTITTGPGPGFDDDRTLTINSPLVNEASDYAVFTLTGNSGHTVSLQLQDESSNGTVSGKANILENQTLKIWDGLAWVNYDANNLPTFDVNGKIFVRVDIIAEQDTPFEGAETFKLNATLTGQTTAVTGVATVIDDGTGVKYPGTFTSGSPTTDSTNLDNDQLAAITVTGGNYNENSPRAVFTVNASSGQVLTLDVQNAAQVGKAPTGDNEGKPNDSLDTADIYYSLDGGATWQLYTGPITAGNVPVLVAVDIGNERDSVYEGEEQLKLVVTSGGQSASGYASIFDDGTGTVTRNITQLTTNDTGANDPAVVKDDDRPVPVVTPLAPPPAPSPSAPPVLLAPPPPLATPVPSFASALTPLAHSLVPADPPGLSMIDAVTSGSGYQIPVSETAPPGLSLYQGITDQFVQAVGAMTKISLPFDAFIHSNKDAVIKLEAKQADNSNLPSWVQFDPATGVFEVTPPPGFKGKLDLKVVARDDDGREAVAIFQMFIGEQDQQRPQSRDSFSEKLRMAGKRPITLVRVADASIKLVPREIPVRETVPVRARAG